MSDSASLSLRIHDSHGAFRDVDLRQFPAVVGRQEGSDVWIDDPKVSREHVRFEIREDAIYCVDLGSRNGFRWNGKQVREAPMRGEGRMRIGQSRIEVRRVSVPKARPTAPSRSRRAEGTDSSAVLDGVQARERRMKIGAFVVVLLLVVGVGYYVSTTVVEQTDQIDPEVAAVQEAADDFRKRFGSVKEITRAHLAEIDAACAEHASVDFGEAASPLDKVRYDAQQRYAAQEQRRVGDIILKKRQLTIAKEYGELLTLMKNAVDSHKGSRSQELTLISMLRDTEALVQQRYNERMQNLTYLESGVADYPEIDALYRESLGEFANTKYAAALEERHAALEKPVAAVTAGETQESSEATTVAPQSDERLLALLRDVLATPEKFGRRRYLFTVFEGRPLRFDEGDVLVVATDDEDEPERTLPYARVPKATRLKMAYDVLEGERLLTAVDVAFLWGHEVIAGRMLHRYIHEVSGKDERQARRQEVWPILARARGISPVPEGGFEFHEKYGWESERDRTERVVLVEVEKTTEKWSARTKVAALKSGADEIEGHLANEELSERLRKKIRKLTVDTLQQLREELAASIGDSATKLLKPLRAEKEELNRRREVAKKVIYDPVIYLPENHPDWPKGDRINGQLDVDEKVRAVREIWDAAEKKTLRVPKAAWRAVSLISALDDELLPRFGILKSKDVDPRLVEFLRNPYPELNVRNFSLDDKEAKIYRFSRKVEEYNRAFSNPDLTIQDQNHCIHMNDYREMFGHQRCFIDIRLCRATKKHSEVCNNAGSIWHDGPNGTPQSRAKAEGFESGVAENVAIGYSNPKGIWDQGWYRASDHHRNALDESHNCIGYGYVGRVGTQNFATIDPPFEFE